MQRISKLTLQNFKFFYGEREINFERKNVLLYGENGSGKSTIYWALYTFLQSTFKSNDEDIKKYFDPSSEYNLVNRFMPLGNESAIIVDFTEDDGTITTKTISYSLINTKSGTLVTEASITSDFINYRILSTLYSFRHSHVIDLFSTFEEDILMFITFGSEVIPGKRNANDWWNYISKGLEPRANIGDERDREFQAKVTAFNSEFRTYLNKIIETANEYIQNKFRLDLKLNINYTPCTYNAFVEGTKRRDHITKPPKIVLTVDYKHSKLVSGREVINKPHSFLNEARLTSIALSIRLAILEEKYIDGAPKILVLDDLLISLDMSNRDAVLDIILSEFKEYQIIIMSHDRSYFELAKHKIKKIDDSQWKYIEMYENIEDGIPQPFIITSDSYLEKAKKFFSKNEYEVCGNFLRKEAEAFCKDFLPRRKQYTPDYTLYDLNGLIHQSLVYAGENGLLISRFEELDSYRKFVLNSTSHDSYDVPKFNSEIKSCIETLDNLRLIKLHVIFKKGDKVEFSLTSDPGGDVYKFEIVFQEQISLIKEVGVDSILPKAMVNYNVYKNGAKTQPETQHGVLSLKKMYDDCYLNSDKAKSADFWEETIFIENGQKLKELKIF